MMTGEDDLDTEAVLEEQNARKQTLALDSIKQKSLKLNSRNKKLARIAISNGSVFAKGKDKKTGKRKDVDSESFPLIEEESLPPFTEFLTWFLGFCSARYR